MSRFRVGDVCEIVNSGGVRPEWIHQVGMVGAIVEICAIGDELGYRLDCDGPSPYYWRAKSLRLRRPPSWDKWIFDTSDVPRDANKDFPATPVVENKEVSV